jgi:uncharacterized OB-fold protein
MELPMTNPYCRVTDPFPLQNAEVNAMHVFYDHLAEGRFTTTKCLGCGNLAWPPRRFCGECCSDRFEWIELPQHGRIHGFTIQEAGVPAGFQKPLIFAVVEVAGLRMFTTLIAPDPQAVSVGQPVRFTPLAVADGPDGRRRFLPAFTLA